MARTDHHRDPDAPKPTGIVIAASAFVLDDAERLLMIRRAHRQRASRATRRPA